MNLTPLLDASLAIQIHVAAIIPAALAGPYLFLASKGTPVHRLVGKVWLGLMVVAALSSFFIGEIDLLFGFSPIHLLSIFVLYSSWQAIAAARRHRIRQHRNAVASMYVGGILIAGGFALLPGRIMHQVLLTYPASWPDPIRLLAFVAMMSAICAILMLAGIGMRAAGRQVRPSSDLPSS